MKKTINLNEYLNLGGKLENLNLEKTVTDYGDSNRGNSISSIILGKLNKNGDQLYNVSYNNGVNKDYAGIWIETEVTMMLDSKFTK